MFNEVQGTGKTCLLLRGFVISGFFSIQFTITGLKNIDRYTGVFDIWDKQKTVQTVENRRDENKQTSKCVFLATYKT